MNEELSEVSEDSSQKAVESSDNNEADEALMETSEFQADTDDFLSDNESSLLDILTSGSKSINKEFLLTYSGSGNVNSADEAKTKCKILKFSSEWSCDEVLSEVAKLSPKIYENLFIFIFELNINSKVGKKSKQFLKLLKQKILKFGKNRPLVLQVTSKEQNVTKTFYKEEKSKNFIKIKPHPNEPDNLSNFQSFYWFFMNTKAEDFDNLVQKLNFGSNSILVLRFLRTLNLSEEFFRDLALKCGSSGSVDELLAVLDVAFNYETGKVESIASKCLAKEFEFPDGVKSVLLNAVEQSNMEIINFIVQNCRHLIINLHPYHKFDISNAAFAQQQFSLLCDFIELCDFIFPKGVDEVVVEDERMKKIINSRAVFHKAIKDGDETKIMEFIESHPNIKNAFHTNNYSALCQAFDSKKFKIFFLLESHGFRAVEYGDYKEEVDPNDLNKIKSAENFQRNRNISSALKSNHSSINSLSNKSFIHNRNIDESTLNEYQKQIRKWYEEIYTTELNRLQIDVVVTCPELKIIYDFDSKTTERIDFNRDSEGITYPHKKWIFIGAKPSSCNESREKRIKGVIAHEINHYVMRMVYQNNEHPYFKEDEEAARIFKEITEVLKAFCAANDDDECDKIISIVFSGYNSEDHQAELAVRVAHILAQFGADKSKIDYLTEKFKQLFDFAQNHVIPDLKKYLTFEHEKVRELNTNAGVLPVIKALDYNFINVKDTNELTKNRLTVVTTNQPKLLLLKIYKDLQSKYGNLVDTKNIFVNFKNFDNSKDFKDISAKNPNLNVFVDYSGETGDILKFINDHESINYIFIVSNENESKTLKIMSRKLKLIVTNHEINISWNNLDTKSQDKLLNTKIKIRNHQVTLFELLSKSHKEIVRKDQQSAETSNKEENKNPSELINEEVFDLVLNHSGISMNSDFGVEKEEKEFKVSFISRSFKKIKEVASKSVHDEKFSGEQAENSQTILKNLNDKLNKTKEITENISEDKLLGAVQNEKFVILSDIAGSGKSWALQNFSEISSERYSTFWVSKIQLKEFIKTFKIESETKPEFFSFFTEKILNTKDKSIVEFFKKMYEIGKVLIFLDGFDEIAPDCAAFVTKLAKSFNSNGGNQLWIATRDYFEVDLQKKLDVDTVYKLQPFTEQNGIDLTITNWILDDLGDKIDKISKEDLQKLIKSSENLASYQQKAEDLSKQILNMKISSVGIPQFYKIVAIVMKSNMDERIKLTILKIYAKFVEIQYKRWSYEKGELRKNANIKIQSSFALGFIELHIFFAMAGIYSEIEYFCGLEFNSEDWPVEEIIACGLLIKIGENTFFIHETFREYFAAQFIVRCLQKGGKRDDEDFCKYFIDFLTIPKYGIIRMFLDEAFDEEALLKKAEQKIPKIAEFFYKNVLKFNSISEIFEKNQKNLKNFVKKIFAAGKYEDVKKTLFNSIETLFDAAEKYKNCLALLDFIFSILNAGDAIDLVMKVDMVNRRGDHFIHLVVKYHKSDIIEKTFEILLKMLNPPKYREIIESKGFKGRNLLQQAACISKDIETLKFLWKFFRDFYKTDEAFLKFLKEVDSENSNVFDHAACFSTSEIFEFMIEELEKIAPLKEVKNILSTLGYAQYNLLQAAASQNDSLELNKCLWKIMRKYFDSSEIVEFVIAPDVFGYNLLYFLCSNDKPKITELVWKEIKNSLDSMNFININILINECDACVEEFIVDIKDSEKKEELKSKLKELEEKFKLERALKSYERILSQDSFPKDLNDIHNFAICPQLELHQKIWEHLLNKCENFENLTNLLLQKNVSGNNYIHMILFNNELKITEFVLTILKEKLPDEQYSRILKSKDKKEQNLIQIAVHGSKDIETHKCLWKLFREFYKFDEEFLNFLSDVYSKSDNIFHTAAGHAPSESFEFMFEELEKIANIEQVKSFLFSEGYADGNLLYSATAFNKSIKAHETLWEIIEKYFNEKEILKMIYHRDIDQDTIFHNVVFWNIKEIVEFTWEKIKNYIREEKDQIEYLKMTGHIGHSLIEMSEGNKSDDKNVKVWVENLQNF